MEPILDGHGVSHPEFPFNEERADRVVRFFKHLRHTKGEWKGKPFGLLGWQKEALRELFGREDGYGNRLYRTAYYFMPRKNGKSEFAAGQGLYLALADREPTSEVYSAASEREQARIVHTMAKSMIAQSPFLSKHTKVYKDSILKLSPTTNLEEGSFYRTISADAYSKHGYSPHGVVFDEVHAQKNRELWDVLETGTGARRQPLTVSATTAGSDRQSLAFELYRYSKGILKGQIEDPTFFPVIYEADPEDDWTDPEVWAKANPSFGHIVKEQFYRSKLGKAKSSPAAESTFRRLYLNQWTSDSDKWLNYDVWQECDLGIDDNTLRGLPAYGGLDLASTQDVAVFTLAFPLRGGVVAVRSWYWIPEDTVVKNDEQRGDRKYSGWVRSGKMTATPGNIIDHERIEKTIIKLADRYNIREIAVDRWNSTATAVKLQNANLEVIPTPQTTRQLSAATRHVEKLALGKHLDHAGDPIFLWMADNVVLREDSDGNVKPDRKKSSDKIDGIVSTVMAVNRLILHTGDGKPKSVYDERDMIIL